MTGPDSTEGPQVPGLRRLRLLARAALAFERVWPAIWPALGVLGVFAAVALLDVPRRVPPLVHAIGLALTVVTLLALLWRGLAAVRLPGADEADRRLERDSGLRHRPLAVLTDRPALPGADALWQAHRARAAAQVRRLRLGLPRPGLAARDPRALRLGLLVVLAACVWIAGEEAPSRLRRAAWPHFAPPAAEAAAELQAWITPPADTALPPVFLRPEGGSVSVPEGSHLTVSLSGGHGVPSLTLAGDDVPFVPADAGSFQAETDLAKGGALDVRRNGATLARWQITLVPAVAPLVRWTEPPGAAKGTAKIPPARLPWEVSHDYGVTGLQAELHLSVRPDAPPLVVQIPLPGGAPKSARGVRSVDLTAHPWAGLAVTGKLEAHDAAGRKGRSDAAEFTLPERVFENPTARALLAVRKNLSLWPGERMTAAGELDRIAQQEQVWRTDIGGLLNLRAIIAEVSRTRGYAAVQDAQARLWQLALHLEEAGPERTARQLSEARQALRDALQAEHPDQKEIEQRIAELEAAIQKHLDALAEEMKRDPEATVGDPDAPKLDPQKLKDLAEQLRKDMQQGKQADAKQRMAELEKLLDKLQAARPQHRDAAQQKREQQRRKGQEEMSALQDIVKREGGILDRAQARSGPERSGAPPEAGAKERQADQRLQQALRRAVGELMQQFGDLTGEVPPNLGDADAAMRDAIDALGKARDQKTASAAQAAIEALQKGGQSMSEMLAQQFGNPGNQQGDQEGEPSPGLGTGTADDGEQPSESGGNRPWAGRPGKGQRGDRRTDPLGRPMQEGASGNNQSTDVALPEEMEQARTRALQDELRKRGGEKTRPQPELDYIDRLLKTF